MAQIDVVVIDANNLFRAGLVSLLSTMGFEHVAEADSIQDLTQFSDGLPDGLPPKVVLVELSNGASQAIETIRQVRTLAPDTRTVFLANDLDIELLSSMSRSLARKTVREIGRAHV